MFPYGMTGKRKYEVPFSRPFTTKWPRNGTRPRPAPVGNTLPSTSYATLGITFDNPVHQSTLMEYARLNRKVVPTRYVDDDVLSKLGLEVDVKPMFERIGWTNFMYARDHTYDRLTLEFLASFETEIFEGYNVEKGKVKFQLMGNKYDFTLAEFNQILDLPVVEGGDRKTPKSFQENLFWFKLTGLSYDRSDSCSNDIRNPCFRYVHRILSSTIFGRTLGADKVRVDELYLMYCMVDGHRVDTGAFLATHLYTVARSKSKEILVGGFITSIARRLGLAFSDLPVVEGIERLNFSACFSMKMVEQVGEGYNWLLEDKIRGTMIRFPLPNVERTTVRDEANWLFPSHGGTPWVLDCQSQPSSSLPIPSRPTEPVPNLANSERLEIAALFEEQKRQGALLESLVSMLKEVRDWQLRHDSSFPPSSDSVPPSSD